MNPAPSQFMYYVYVLKSDKHKWSYVGSASNLLKRIAQHDAGESCTTKKYLPIKLVYCEAYASKLDAEIREKRLKNHGNALGLLKKRIQNSMKEGAG